jgi:hypothetical protein
MYTTKCPHQLFLDLPLQQKCAQIKYFLIWKSKDSTKKRFLVVGLVCRFLIFLGVFFPAGGENG